MKVFVLILFSLIFSVNSEDAKPVETKKIEAVYPLNKDNYNYGKYNEENGRYRDRNYNRNEGRPSEIYGENKENNYYSNQGYLSNEEYGRYRERNYNRNEGRPSEIYGNNNYGYGREDEYSRNNRKNGQYEREIIGYYARDPEGRRFYNNKRNYQYRLIGRVGLGFDKRTANAYSYVAPITPERLELVGTRPFQLNNNGYNYQNLNLYRGSNVGKYV